MMKKCCAGLVLGGMVAFGAFADEDRIVWKDSFEDPSTVTNWHCESGYTIRKGEGIGGSGALVWEESKVRPKPPPGSEPESLVEDNIVRKLPQDGRKVFRRKIPVEPGCRYYVSVKLHGAITNNCGYLFFDWYDNKGVRQGHYVTKPTIWKEVGTNGWQTLTTSSLRMPSTAAMAYVYIETYRSTLGKMRFDDFTVTCDRPRNVELMFSSAYRDEQTKGKVRFAVPYTLSKGMDLRDVSGRFTFAGVDGPFTLAADGFTSECFDVSVDAERLAVGKHWVKAEFLHKGTVTDSCQLLFDRPEKLSARKVRIDEKGMTFVNGKPFFPIGVFVHPRDKELKYVERMKGGPFNCVIECAPHRRLLNKLHAAGLMAIPKSPKTAEAVKRVYKSVKEHPAVLAWYVIDEAQPVRALSEIPLQKLRREIDPDHPTIAVLNQAENTGPLMGSYDIIARDPYPLSVNCHYPPNCDQRDLLDVAFWPKLMKDNGYGIPPVWQAPQAFSWGWLRNRNRPDLDRYPTRHELRSMAWQSVAGGANGMLWYAASMIFSRAKVDLQESERCWSDLVAVAEELAAKMDYFVSLEEPPQAKIDNDQIAVRTYRLNGKVAVLAANRVSKPVSGIVSLGNGMTFDVKLPAYGVEWMERECR